MYEWLTTDPIGISVFSFVRNMIYFLIVVRMVEWITKRWNNSVGVGAQQGTGGFSAHVMPHLMREPMAAAVYFGARILGLCILAAAFVK